VATLPNALRRDFDDHHAQDQLAVVRTLLHSIYDQPDADSVVGRYDRSLSL
jgi:hypothetical protein